MSDDMQQKFLEAAKNYVRCARGNSHSPYIKENGLFGGSPWADFVNEHDAMLAAAPKRGEG